MYKLYDAQSDVLIGEISQAQIDFLRSLLEEETTTDRDYYINPMTIDLFEEKRADPALVSLLRSALGDRDDMDIRWE